jgi:ketoreductase RED1
MNDGTKGAYRSVTVVGGGVIGVSWTALFLGHGLRVTVSDPRPDIEDVVHAGLGEIAPAMQQLGLPIGDAAASAEALRFESRLGAAVAGADVVQENGPERLNIKRELWAAIEDAAPPHALLLSSSSGIPATMMAEHLREPGRLLIGHPFNPPHLVPLVEIVPGRHTDPDVVERATRFYRALGKRPQVLAKEVPGFAANRLQAALFREAIYLVAQGVVTEQQLDDIVTSSIGMRWAVAGPFQTFHLGGGPGGLPDFFRHLGKALEGMWGDLGAPHLDKHNVALLSEQAQHFGGTIGELSARRDVAEIALMRALGEIPEPSREQRKQAIR